MAERRRQARGLRRAMLALAVLAGLGSSIQAGAETPVLRLDLVLSGSTADSSPPNDLLDQARTAGLQLGIDGLLEPAEAAPPDTASAPLTPLELSFSQRAGAPLRQIGYDALRPGPSVTPPAFGALPDDYVLGIGDELAVSFRGGLARSHLVRIDRDGRISLPGMPPLPVAGLDLGTVRALLEGETAALLPDTRVHVAVAGVRSLTVTVLGEVGRPGHHALTGLSTALDALAAAEGVRRTGSLRAIQLHRDGSSLSLDLYDLLLIGGGPADLRLRDGDRLFVPRLGPVAAVAGAVLVPGIYELAPDGGAASLADLLVLAGGAFAPAGSRFLHLRADADGRDAVVERRDLAGVPVRQADLLLVERGAAARVGTVDLAGHVRTPGSRALSAHPTLRALVPDRSALGSDPYPLFAVLRTAADTGVGSMLVPVDLDRVLRGEADRSLRDGDRLTVLSRDEVRYLLSADVQAVLAGRPPPVARGATATGLRAEAESVVAERTRLASLAPHERACRGLTELHRIVGEAGPGRFAGAARMLETDGDLIDLRPCPALFDTAPEILPLALEHVASVRGAVRHPGAYPILDPTALDALLAAAGGMTRGAALDAVEVTRFRDGGSERWTLDLSVGAATIPVGVGDVVRVPALATDRDGEAVTLIGEVVHPGHYDIRRGETLGQLLDRAGGLTDEAYPYGTIFTRRSIAEAERDSFRRMARDMRSALAAALAQPDQDGNRAAIAAEAVERLAATLDTIDPPGRMVVEADPAVLRARPELDTLLHPGDRIAVPRRANIVTVSGQVMNPASLPFASGAAPEAYLRQSGGLTRAADRGRAYLLYPDGRAAPLSLAGWSASAPPVPPGSAIVVPQDPAPFSLLALTRDMTQLLSQIALTAASIAVISR